MVPSRTKSCSISVPVSAEHHDGLGLILIDKSSSKILEEPRQGSAFAHGDSWDLHQHHWGRMGEEERGDLVRRGREVIECLKPLDSGLWSGRSHGYGGVGGVEKRPGDSSKERGREDVGWVLSVGDQSPRKGGQCITLYSQDLFITREPPSIRNPRVVPGW